jgi:hypothetical protein
MEAEPWVAGEVAELRRVRHADQQQATLEDPRLHRADPRVSVRAKGGQHAEIARRLVAANEDLRDPRRLINNVLPVDHGWAC